MPVKTILVHLANDSGCPGRLRTAFAMARRLEAHVTCVYITTPVHMPAAVTGRAASGAYIAEATEIARDKAAEAAKDAEAIARQEGMSYEWHVVEGDPVALLAEESRFADLMLVGQNPALTLDDVVSLHPIEELPVVAASACVILPHGREQRASLGRNILIGWKNAHVAARAVHAAIPLLGSADTVTVLTVHGKGESDDEAEALAAFLSRHCAHVTVTHHDGSDRDAGAVILSTAESVDADLVVMGAYGHHRWREFIFGGATSHVSRHMTVPVLFGH